MANYVTYTTSIKLNAKEAKDQLDELTRKVEDLKQKRDAALSHGKSQLGESIAKDLAKATRELKQFQRQTMTVAETLDNLQDASLSQLKRAKQSLSKSINATSDVEEIKRLSVELQKVEDRISAIKLVQKSASTEAEKLVNKTVNLNQILTDSSKASLNQLKLAQNYLRQNIANMAPDSSQYKTAVEQLKQVEQQIKVIEADQQQVNRLIDQYNREIKDSHADIHTTQEELKLVNATLKNMDRASVRDLEYSIKIVNQELRGTERGTEEFHRLTNQAKRLRTELEKVRYEGAAQQSWLNRTADWFNKIQGAAIALVASITGVSMTIRKCVGNFAEMDEAMTDVMKYTGQTKEEVTEMNETFKKMDTRTSREKLNAIAGDAGRLGIASTEMVEQFVDAADKINVALGDDLGDDAVKNIGKLAQMFGEDKKRGLNGAMIATGSAINELAQSSSASAGYLVDFTARLAGVGKQAGLTQQQIMGFASVLDQNMQQDEMAATAFQNLISKMYQEPAKFAAMAGKDVKEFSRMLKEDANGAIMAFFEALKSQGGFDKLAPMFEQMNLDGSRAVGVLSVMAAKLDDVKVAQNTANKAYDEGTSVLKEFDTQMTSAQAQLDMAKKRFNDLSIELGEKLMPIARYAITGTSAMVKILSVLIDFLGKFKWTIGLLTVAITVYAAKAVIATAATKTWAFITSTAKTAMTGLNTAIKANPLGLLLGVVTTAIALFADFRSRTDELSEAKKVMNEVDETASKSIAKQKTKMEDLKKAVESNNLSLSTRQKALKDLKAMVPEYHGQLTTEGQLINNNTKALDDYINNLYNAARARAAYDKKVAIEGNNIQHEMLLKQRQQNQQWALNKIKAMGLEGFEKSAYDLNSVTFKDKLGNEKKVTLEVYKQYKHYVDLYNWNEKRIQQEQAILDINKKQTDTLDKIIGADNKPEQQQEQTTTTTKPIKYVDPKKAEAERRKQEAARKKAFNQEIKDQKSQNEAIQAELIEQYSRGDILYKDYINKKHEAAIEGYNKLIDIHKKYGEEYGSVLDDQAQEGLKQEQDNIKISLNQIERDRQQALAKANQDYADSNSEIYHNDLAMTERIFEIEIEASDKRINALKKGSEQWFDEKNNREVMQQQHQVEMQEQYADLLTRYREEWGRRDVALEEKIALDGLEALNKKKLLKEEEYQRMKREILMHYAEQKSQENLKNSSSEVTLRNASSAANTAKNNAQAEYNNTHKKPGFFSDITVYAATMKNLEAMYKDDETKYAEYQEAKKQATADFLEGMVAKAQAAFSTVNNVMSAASSYYAASSQYEQNVTSKKYDKMIQKAEGNSVKQKKLEEKKEKELAKIKSKYNKKQMKIELAQAFASTAMAAINAYASAAKVPLIGHTLAPIAAAMATAAGMLQIATIKKQHAAEQAGYYSGGFTGGKRYNEEAGVVHQGEFVANHDAVNNPNVMPILRLIDVAQKNNTIGSLTTADVSRQLGLGANAVIAPVVNVNNDNSALDASLSQVNDTISVLNENIKDGIAAVVSFDDFDHKYTRYKKMKDV